jgi:Zn-dependent peptidase ImmA (M78 family)
MKIKIGDIGFEVKEVDGSYCCNNMGKTNTKCGLIHINESLNDDIKANTLFHEILHVIACNYAIFKDEDEEERAIECFANGIMAFIKDNTKFFIDNIVKR